MEYSIKPMNVKSVTIILEYARNIKARRVSFIGFRGTSERPTRPLYRPPSIRLGTHGSPVKLDLMSGILPEEDFSGDLQEDVDLIEACIEELASQAARGGIHRHRVLAELHNLIRQLEVGETLTYTV
jgi:hypothetical protein